MLDRGFSLLASLPVMIFIIGAATIAGIVLLNIASIFVTDLMITRPIHGGGDQRSGDHLAMP